MDVRYLLAAAAIAAPAFCVAGPEDERIIPRADTTVPADIPPGSSMSPASAGSAYAALDRDDNGTISNREAGGNVDLQRNWDKVDANDDGAVDPAEFAAFEARPTAPRGP